MPLITRHRHEKGLEPLLVDSSLPSPASYRLREVGEPGCPPRYPVTSRLERPGHHRVPCVAPTLARERPVWVHEPHGEIRPRQAVRPFLPVAGLPRYETGPRPVHPRRASVSPQPRTE